jgi:hypothetical protein
MVNVSAWVEESIYKKFKEICKTKDLNMSQVIRKLIKAEVEKDEASQISTHK